MKSNIISSKIVIVNPTPNLIRLSQMIRSFGYEIIYASTDLYYPKFFDSAYIVGEKIVKCDLLNGVPASDELFFHFKKGFFSKMKLKKYAKNTDFTFASILKRYRILKESQPVEQENTVPLDEILNSNESFGIIYSYLPENYKNKAELDGEKLYVFQLEAEEEFSDLFDESRFFLFENEQIEIFRFGNYIIIVGRTEKIDLTKVYKYIHLYNVKVEKAGIVIKNFDPWVKVKVAKKDTFYFINDYSIFNFSLRLIDEWYEKLARFICVGKRQ